MKAMQTPGRVACATASLTRVRLRRNMKQPAQPPAMPSKRGADRDKRGVVAGLEGEGSQKRGQECRECMAQSSLSWSIWAVARRPPYVSWSTGPVKVVATGPFRDLADVQHEHMVEIVCHGCQVVMDADDGLAFRLEPLEHVDNGFFRGSVHAGKGLVQQIEICLLCQGASKKDTLLLPTGELADLAICEIRHTDTIQTIQRLLFVGETAATSPAARAGGTGPS